MVKGIRDVATAAIVFILIGLSRRRALGWVVLADAVIPLGDALAVITHGGTVATAVSVHVSAAALVVLTAVLLLTDSRNRQASGNFQPAETSPQRHTSPTP